MTIIQACQDYARLSQLQGAASQPHEGTSSDSESETDLARPTQTLHVILTRPHTVLLLATVTGGVAYRGAFTGAFATQLSSSDGNTDIYSMYNQAVAVMKADGQYIDQNPKFESVTYKQLVLQSARHT